MVRRTVLLVLVLALAAPDAAQGEESPTATAAARFLAAYRARDTDAMARIAAEPASDPVDLAAMFWFWRLLVLAKEPDADFLDAAADLAQRAAVRADARGLADVVRAHRQIGGERLAAEARRATAWREARKLGAPAARLAAHERLAAEATGAQPSLLTAALLASCAEVLEAGGRRDLAARAYETSARHADALPWIGLAARSWQSTGRLATMRGVWPEAVVALEQAAARMVSAGWERPAASILANLALVQRRQGKPEASAQTAEQAERLARRAGDARLVARARLARAAAWMERARFDEAATALQRVAVDAARAGDEDSARTARLNLGLLFLRRGRLAEALTIHEEELARLAAAPPSRMKAAALRNAGVILRELGRYAEARALQTQALTTYLAMGDRGGAGAARLNLGAVAVSLGELGPARTQYRAAAEAAWRAGDFEIGSLATLNLAALERRSGKTDVAIGLVEDVVQRCRAARRPVPAIAWSELGKARLDHGQTERALEHFAVAVQALGSSAEGPRRASAVHASHAAALRAAGRFAEALAPAQQALALRRESLAGLEPGEADALGLRVAEIAGLGLDIAARLRADGILDEDAAAAEAFRFAEWSRGLLLVESLRSPAALVNSTLPDDLRQALEAASTALTRARRALARALALGAAADIDRAREELRHAHEAREAALARAHRHAGRLAQVVWPRPLELEGVRTLLAPHEAFVLYQIAEERLYAIVIRADHARLLDLGAADGLAEDARAWRLLASVPRGPDGLLATRLHARLIAPLAADLHGVTSLIASPDGPLAFVPLDALRDKASGKRLLARMVVRDVPSASVFALLRSLARPAQVARRVLAVGDPSRPATLSVRARDLGFALPRPLPGSRREAQAVVDRPPRKEHVLLVGADATRARFLRTLAAAEEPWRAIHLACHARLDGEHPRLTGLLLAGGDVLDVHDVHRLTAPADLVVLSGCETGRGALVRGDGVLGLVRGFFVAGARSVVASTWKVSDRATLELMRRFYAGLESGAPPADALARAKREMLARGGEDAHPAHWAGFVLWGP